MIINLNDYNLREYHGELFLSDIGEKRNYLEVLSVGVDKNNCHPYFVCRCDCGKFTRVQPYNWRKGFVKSCGCMSKQLLHEALYNPNARNKKRLYNIWIGMKMRCYNKKERSYKYYGYRGISICDEWRNDFSCFEEWALSHGYSDDLSIDRIDVNGNYEPSNCRWATIIEQANNKRPVERRVKLTIDGVEKSLIEWCDIYGVSTQFIHYRIKNGMTAKEAFERPKMAGGRPRKKVS